MRFSYSERLKADLIRWVEEGLINRETGDRMLADAIAKKSGWSFSTVVALLGVISLCFAAMSFVAANWVDIPRFGRVLMLLAGLWASYIGGGYLYRRDHAVMAQVFILLGSGLFGASIMLVGQMYHLQGDASDAVLVWMAGSLVAALALWSIPTLCLSVMLSLVWLGMNSGWEIDELTVSWYFPLIIAVFAVSAYAMKSRFAAHLVAITAIIWVLHSGAILSVEDETFTYALAIYCFFFAVIGWALLSLDQGQLLRGFEAALIIYLLIIIVAMAAVWVAISLDVENVEEAQTALQSTIYWPALLPLLAAVAAAGFGYQLKSEDMYDLTFVVAWIVVGIGFATPYGLAFPFAGDAIMLALSVWMIRMGGRQDIAGVRRIGYLAFSAVMLLVYFRAAGTFLGTTGFYTTAGLLMVIGAIAMPRILRRRAKSEEETA